MKEKKTWFIGFTSRFWIPVSFEGWLVTAAFFLGMMLIGKLNNVPNNSSLNISQILAMVIEFIILLGVLYFITKDHVDKRY